MNFEKLDNNENAERSPEQKAEVNNEALREKFQLSDEGLKQLISDNEVADPKEADQYLNLAKQIQEEFFAPWDTPEEKEGDLNSICQDHINEFYQEWQKDSDAAKEEIRQEMGDITEEHLEKFSQSLYKSQRDKMISEKLRNYIKDSLNLELSNQLIEEEHAEFLKATMDPVTELPQRRELFKKLDGFITETLGVSQSEEVLRFLENIDEEKLENYQEINGTVVAADAAYLNIFNKEGHDMGDEFLSRLGKAIKEEKVETEEADMFMARIGGDEFGGLLKGTEGKPDPIQQKVEGIQSKFKELMQGGSADKNKEDSSQKQNLAQKLYNDYKLEPQIDFGWAHFSESLEVLSEVAQNKEGGKEELEKNNPIKELENIWVDIADARAFREKARERIEVLMNLKQDHPDKYKIVKNYLKKGAYDISDQTLDQLNAQEDTVKNFINRQEEIKRQECI
mgnify:CR=1 FL=1